MCDRTRACVPQVSIVIVALHDTGANFIGVGDMAHSYGGHDSFIPV